MTGDISYDLVMGDDMGFVEGTFRLPGSPWQVIIVRKGTVRSSDSRPSGFPARTGEPLVAEQLCGRGVSVTVYDIG